MRTTNQQSRFLLGTALLLNMIRLTLFFFQDDQFRLVKEQLVDLGDERAAPPSNNNKNINNNGSPASSSRISRQQKPLFIQEEPHAQATKEQDTSSEHRAPAEEDQEQEEHSIDYFRNLSKQRDDSKMKILDLLENNAGLTALTQRVYDTLPPWSDITGLYGTSPKIIGLEQCSKYRRSLHNSNSQTVVAGNDNNNNIDDPRNNDRKGLAIAGLFNSGTNLLYELLITNCNIQFSKTATATTTLTSTNTTNQSGEKNSKRKKRTKSYYIGIHRKPSWGKHNPPPPPPLLNNNSLLENLTTTSTTTSTLNSNNNNPQQQLPVVTIRDPFRWMKSMCKTPYNTIWPLNNNNNNNSSSSSNNNTRRCPLFIPTPQEEAELLQKNNHLSRQQPMMDANGTKHHFPVQVTYSKQHITKHYSMVHLWNDWYHNYLDLPPPPPQQQQQQQYPETQQSSQEEGVHKYYHRHQYQPRMLVRLEDLIFYPDQVIPKLCKCAGGHLIKTPPPATTKAATTQASQQQHQYHHVRVPITSSKTGIRSSSPSSSSRSGQTNYLEAIVNYGTSKGRIDGLLDPPDLMYAQKYLSQELMDVFHYPKQ